MAEELKELLEKIQEEGVKAAENKAKSIEEKAAKEAESILAKARKDAEKIISESAQKVARMEKSTKDSLKQAGRDVVLGLRKEINSLLDKIITSRIDQALTPTELVSIIKLIAKESKDNEKQEITVSLNKKNLEIIEKSLLKELKEETKKGIILKPSEEIRGGFIISYDKGKSYYDFTDTALTEYIGSYIKPKLAEILKTGKTQK